MFYDIAFCQADQTFENGCFIHSQYSYDFYCIAFTDNSDWINFIIIIALLQKTTFITFLNFIALLRKMIFCA